jgi:uncharacterized repeat protein (TIGR01451 family)
LTNQASSNILPPHPNKTARKNSGILLAEVRHRRSSLFMLHHLVCLSRKAFSSSLLFACFVLPAFGQIRSTFTDVQHDVSRPLRDLVKTPPAPFQMASQKAPATARVAPLPEGFKPPDVQDPVLQETTPGNPAAVATPVAGLNFEGLGQGFAGFTVLGAPADPSGAVGLTQYVQAVNFSFAVFDKATGNLVAGPAPGNSLWQGFGGSCENNNNGEPSVVYDKLADRWIFSQFAVVNSTDTGFGPFFQCVAVSTTPDATGTYNRYAFQYSSFNDDTKIGVWPDAYYVTLDFIDTVSGNSLGADACAYDRSAMLAGLPATQICFQQDPSVGILRPADLDGHNPPPAGSPNYMATFGVNTLNLYKFHVDFATPANSTFTGPTAISVAPFTPLCPSVPCVNQPNTATQLQSLGDRLMSRLAYRNFGDHESLVVNQSVAVGTGSGVRWYEIQNPNSAPTVAQQSTFAPDTDTFRWMGSIAMDQVGDIALGYNISSDSIFPSIGFASRAAGDPTSTLGAETTIVSGAGSQTEDLFGDLLTVWGGYSDMQVDPSDDCTFWYTAEYMATTGIFNWNTRIANFKYSGCDRPDLTISSTHAGNFTQGQTSATYTLNTTNVGGQDSTGTVTVIDTLPSGVTATAISGTGWSCDLPTLTCTRTDVVTAGAAYPAITLTVNVATDTAGIVNNVAAVSGGGELNAANDTSTDATTVIQLGPDPTIAISHAGTFIQGQTGTYNISVSNAGLSALDGSVVTVTDTLPSGLTANAVSGAGWTCVVGPPVKCTRSDALASNANYPVITLTVNIAGTAPAAVTNRVSVAGGGETNTLNDTASDVVGIIPPPADMTISMSHAGSFQQGQSFATYTITVSNTGTGSTSGIVTVTDTLPTGLTFTNMFGNGWSCSIPTCTRRDVLAAAGSYPPITVNVNVAGNAPATLTNTALVSGGGEVNTANDTATDPTSITAEPDLTITKTHVGDFTVGQNGIYTITVSNAGSAPTIAPPTAQTANIFDFLPEGMTATAITATGWTCPTVPTTVVSCSRSDVLAAGASYPPITITVNVSGGFASSETNFANVSGGGELNTANDNASDPTNVKAPVLAITTTHAPATLTVGQTGTYTINISNTGTVSTINSTSNPVTVTDFLPQGMTPTDMSGSIGWTCTTSFQFFSCTRSDVLAPGSSYPAVIATVQINGAPSNGAVINSATVTGGGDLNNHSASDTATVSGPTLTITKTHSPATLVVGQTATYTITVGNTGTTPTVTIGSPVSVNDFVPQGMTVTDLSASAGWTCTTPPTTFVNCTRSDTLASGSTYPPIVMTVRIDGASSGATTVTNSATVVGGGDLTPHSASDVAPISAPVLNITKTHVGNFTVGQTGDYTITVSNTGTIATQGIVTVIDSLPFGLTATAINAPGWTCTTLPVNCSRSDSLAAGAGYPAITLTVSIDSTASVNLTNFVSVSGGGDLSFHSAQDSATIIEPDLQVTETHNGAFFAGETNAVYTINVNNIGTIATAGGTVSLFDSLSTGLTATAASGTGWLCGQNFPTPFVNCTRTAGTLAPGSAYPPLQVTVTIAPDAPSNALTTVNLSGIGDANAANNFISDSIPVARVAVITNSSPAVTVTAGSSATFAFTANLATSPSVGTVTFSATGLPPNSTAVFSPATVTQTGAVALTINTSGNGHVASLSPADFLRQVPPGFALLISMAGMFVAAFGLRKRKKALMRWAFSLSCFCLLLAFSGCGGGGGGSTPPPNPTPTPVPTPTPPPTTQAGTYTITVIATSSDPTVAKSITQVTLTVQ